MKLFEQASNLIDMKLDILAVGAHPDDVELGCAGTLIKSVQEGKKVGIVDITQSELSTRGSVSLRKEEAKKAGGIIGITMRKNLQMPDGFFKSDLHSQLVLVNIIRKYRPTIIIANGLEDRHPDHGRGARFVIESCLRSSDDKVQSYNMEGCRQAPWGPSHLFHYIQDRFTEPNFIVDVSEVWEQKIACILAYRSQFYDPENTLPDTYISRPEFMKGINSRGLLLGKRIGVKYGEGFTSYETIGVKNFDFFCLHAT